MSRIGQFLSRFKGTESGQVLPIMAMMMLLFLGMAALALDGGRAMYTARELQAVTDSAALAGAQAMPSASTPAAIIGSNGSGGVVMMYSAATGGFNARTALPTVTEVAKLECLAALQAAGSACTNVVPYNAVQVTQTTVLPMYFAGLFGHKTMALSATSTAASATPKPSNVAIIMDATLSMAAQDSDCGATQMQCALNGVQVLLQHLAPCSAALISCTVVSGQANYSVDRAALFTFPALTTATVAIDTNCTTSIPSPTPSNGYYNDPSFGNYVMYKSPQNKTVTPWSGVPTAGPYIFPGTTGYSTATYTYQVTPFLSDYRSGVSATTLNTTSDIVQAAGGASGCQSMLPPNYDGNIGTYYAGVIYAAQAALVAEQTSFPGSQNILILLSDGNATAPQSNNGFTGMPSPAGSSGTYPSYNGECGQAIDAAAAATAAGTTVYTVAYGSPSTGCTTDANSGTHKGISPCNAMAQMASGSQYFYSDYKQSGSGSTCVASQPVTSLSDIFASIAGTLTTARLIPNGTT